MVKLSEALTILGNDPVVNKIKDNCSEEINEIDIQSSLEDRILASISNTVKNSKNDSKIYNRDFGILFINRNISLKEQRYLLKKLIEVSNKYVKKLFTKINVIQVPKKTEKIMAAYFNVSLYKNSCVRKFIESVHNTDGYSVFIPTNESKSYK